MNERAELLGPATATPDADVLALLTVPAFATMSDDQVRGKTCAWCGIFLAPETAVDLGVRRLRILDQHVSRFPRGCRQCTGQAAYNALFDHAPMCEQCVDNAAGCETGRGLRRLVKEGFRR